MLLTGRKFDLTGVTRRRHGRFIINEEVKSEYRDEAAQSSDDDDPYDPFNQFRMRMAMAEHGMLCPYSSTAMKSFICKIGVLGRLWL